MPTVTAKIVTRSRANADGTHPLIIKILKNGVPSIISTGQTIKKVDWDSKRREVKKSHPNSVRLNQLLAKKKAEVMEKSLELETSNSGVTAKEVRASIRPPAETLFFGQALLYLSALKDGDKYNQYTADRPRIKTFKDFTLNVGKKGGADEKKKEDQEAKKLTAQERQEKFQKYLRDKDISFGSITPGLLDKYVIYLKGLGDKNQRTIANHLAVIRGVFGFADRNDVIDSREVSPFGKKGVKIKFPASKKIGLSPAEVQRLETVELSDQRFDHIRNIWLFNYYFAGMRIADAFRLKWSDINDGRLHYSMGKNAKEDSLKIPQKAQAILDKYLASKKAYNDFVFPELKGSPHLTDKFYLDRQIAFITSRYDKFLRLYIAPAAEIEKTLTMHIGRHTFGNAAGDKIAPQMLQKLYRHAKLETTIGYQANFIHTDVDQALDAVIGV